MCIYVCMYVYNALVWVVVVSCSQNMCVCTVLFVCPMCIYSIIRILLCTYIRMYMYVHIYVCIIYVGHMTCSWMIVFDSLLVSVVTLVWSPHLKVILHGDKNVGPCCLRPQPFYRRTIPCHVRYSW